jgi:phenylpropionate dioxygenase-like ring-hydroxylating dioxygenase large terminal subunit
MPDTQDKQDLSDLPLGPSDLRDKIPVLGLREYWYPALKDRAVGWKKPVYIKMLGDDLCLFRGKSGEVVALDNACPHRGAMLARGKCEFRGHVTCFYHGFVFDERGECVAALGEGPDSPMPGKVRAKAYPTATRKGIVFVWMGKGAPAPLEESIPEEFFEDDKQVLAWVTSWNANWRPCFENSFDSHVRYLHRNSAMLMMRPMHPPAFPPGRPKRVGAHRLAPSFGVHARGSLVPDYFPGLGTSWPKKGARRYWTWLFDLLRAPFGKLPQYKGGEDWGMGQHLPCMVRIHYGSYMWTRWAVPIDAATTRMFYFHTAIRTTWLGRAYEWASYHLFHHWVMDRNFSAQDAPAAIHAYYDRPEYLAPTDAQLVGWRRFLLSARGVEPEE